LIDARPSWLGDLDDLRSVGEASAESNEQSRLATVYLAALEQRRQGQRN
jgi:hypothetical protein